MSIITRQKWKKGAYHMGLIRKKTFSTSDADITFLTFDIRQPDFRAQLLEALAECNRSVGLANIARQTFFLSQTVDKAELMPLIECAYSGTMPATSWILQSPAEGHALSCEMWAFSSDTDIQRNRHVTSAITPSGTWGFVSGLEVGEDEEPASGLSRVLDEARHGLYHTGTSLAQIVRTWYYIGNILGNGEKETPYDRFNAARNECYRNNWPDLRFSPASTGIGMRSNRIAFEGLLYSHAGDDSQVTWIDNPLQTPPCLYDSQAKKSRNPAFSRAAAIRFADTVLLLISGTASIRGSEVLAPEDTEAQIRITIENIATLIGKDNLAGNHGFSRGATVDDIQEYRVYLKRSSDLEVVRDYCRRHLPPVPQIYTVADVCRPGFLVEIEGVAAFKDDSQTV